MIDIIDYGAGNLGSVRKALDYLGVTHRVISWASEWDDPEAVILPGVGAFGASMAKLESRGFVPVLLEYLEKGKPFLGICLGMQLLMESSEEAPGVNGLGAIKGSCLRFQRGKVPQIGWNRVESVKNSPLFRDIDAGAYFYFVHSFYVQLDNPACGSAETDYYGSFTSVLERGPVFGVQFHPEKSGEAGLQLLRNWILLTTKDTKVTKVTKENEEKKKVVK